MAVTINTPLDDNQWATITARLPRTLRARIRTQNADYRGFVDAVLWVVRNDTCWKCMPCDGWHTVYVRFTRWVEQGLWTAVEHGIESDPALVHALRERVALYNRKKQRRRNRYAEPPSVGSLDYPWVFESLPPRAGTPVVSPPPLAAH